MAAIKITLILLCTLAYTHTKSVQKLSFLSNIDELETYIDNKREELNDRWRPRFHVAGPVGWINDPNGFSYYKGQYHLFFQFYPYDSVWGPMHWGHVVSEDLVEWKRMKTALMPGEEQCFSGSAVTDGDKMVLIYTGHIITDDDPFFNQTQYLAYSNDGENFEKYEGNPILKPAPGESADFRDPKMWKNGNHWYVIIGSKTSDDKGNVLLYRSEDMITWEFLRVLAQSDGNLGFMWECPDFFELDGKYVLLMSPQGMEPQGDRFKNIYQTGYVIGDFNYENYEFIPTTEFQEIDFGHDFYAAQTTSVDGGRYLIAWFSSWEVEHPEAEDGWAGMMTIVRELKLHNDTIILQQPLEGLSKLRDEVVHIGDFPTNFTASFDRTADIVIDADLSKNVLVSVESYKGNGMILVSWDPEVGKVVVDRGGDIRQVEWSPTSSQTWRIFLDASSFELFCGDGEVVFSTRVFPDGGWRFINLSEQTLKVQAYTLSRSVSDDRM